MDERAGISGNAEWTKEIEEFWRRKMEIFLDSKCKGDGGRFCFRSMDEVLESGLLQGGTKENPVTLFIAPGVYWMHDPGKDGPMPPRNRQGLPCEKTVRFGWLKITGLSEDPGQVVLASRKGQSFGCIGNYTMFSFEGKGLWVQNLTFGNYCNVDLEYPWEPALSRPKRSATITQAQLASFNGKELLAENCRFVSRLNLLPICGGDISIYRNCHFECTDDSLNSHAVYEGCDFDFYGGCPFWGTERAGAIFRKCLFRVHTGKLQMVKHEGQLAFIDCCFTSGKPTPEPPTEMVNTGLRIYEAGNTWNGKTLSMKQLGLKADALPRALLHWEEEYPVNLKITASAAHLAGNAQLDIEAALISFTGKQILDETVYFEVLSEQTSDGKPFKLLPTGRQKCRIQNCNKGMEAVDISLCAHTADGLRDEIVIKLLPECQKAPCFIAYPAIRQESGRLKAEYQLDIPREQDDSLIVWYRLWEKAGKDAMEDNGVTCCRIAVARGRGSEAAVYTPDMDDVGHLLYAEVQASGCYGEMGDSYKTEAYKVTAEDVLYKNIKETDFRFSPLENREGKGVFLFHAYTPAAAEMPPEWRVGRKEQPGQPRLSEQPRLLKQPWDYGELGGGCVGSGLYPMQQGSSIIYQPCVQAGQKMGAEVIVDTAKTAGQGFGSAGQYMDIILRFVPAGQGTAGCGSGLAVRLKRTVKASDGVEFGLIKYENGVSVPLAEPVIVSCFRTGCHILAEADGSIFRAQISCGLPQDDTQKQKGWLHQASLYVKLPPSGEGHSAGEMHRRGTVEASWQRMTEACGQGTEEAVQQGDGFGYAEPPSGFCLLHTGTCGDKGWFNTIMLHSVRIWYDRSPQAANQNSSTALPKCL